MVGENLKMSMNENSLLLLGNNWDGMGWETHVGHWDENWGKNLDVGHWYWYWEKRHSATTDPQRYLEFVLPGNTQNVHLATQAHLTSHL